MDKEALNRWVETKVSDSKMSYRELGRLAGVDHSYISKILNGQREAALDFYVKIARVFNAIPEMLQVRTNVLKCPVWTS